MINHLFKPGPRPFAFSARLPYELSKLILFLARLFIEYITQPSCKLFDGGLLIPSHPFLHDI